MFMMVIAALESDDDKAFMLNLYKDYYARYWGINGSSWKPI